MSEDVVVGINIGHDGGAAIIVDGEIKCSISEERLNRKKYSHGYLNALFYCLSAAQVGIKDISLIVLSSYGAHLSDDYRKKFKTMGISEDKVITVDHHLSHTYGAYCLSSFKESLVMVMDGQGNKNDTESYYLAKEDKIEKIGGNSPSRVSAKGIGRTYEAFTNFLGWKDQEAGKTMALAAHGDSSRFDVSLFEINGDKVESKLEHKYEKGVIEFAEKFNLDFGEPYSKGESNEGKNAAAYLQKETEKAVLALVNNLVKKTGSKNLCLAGGVALNCQLNHKIQKESLADNLFILPAASDRGQPLGNALYGYYKLTRDLIKTPIENDFHGINYSEKEIIAALKKDHRAFIRKSVPTKKVRFEKKENIEKEAASLIKEGNIVAWFQGRSELGPRALGHRSILADPRRKETREIINKKVKHREWFRPFAPSCLEEKVDEYFDLDVPSPFMLIAAKARKEKTEEIPSVVHYDGTSRIQSVNKEAAPRYYKLIKEFYNLTGVPMVLNTSFNDREPIVETPGDAVSTFLSTDIDYLAIGDYLAWKE